MKSKKLVKTWILYKLYFVYRELCSCTFFKPKIFSLRANQQEGVIVENNPLTA